MKKALVTGGCGGIGEAVCKKLANDGYTVYVNYAHSKERSEKIASEIVGKAVFFDVSDSTSVRSALKDIGFVGLLVNNAGISEIDLFTSISDEKADDILNINLKGAMNCARALLPEMIKAKSGNIINISSMWGQCGASCEVDYSASNVTILCVNCFNCLSIKWGLRLC